MRSEISQCWNESFINKVIIVAIAVVIVILILLFVKVAIGKMNERGKVEFSDDGQSVEMTNPERSDD